MNKHFIICVLLPIAAFPQAQTPLTITQSAGSATGEIRMQERRTNGQNYVGLKAPQSVATNTTWTLPDADGTSGQCLQTDGAGQWQWAACTNTRLVSDYDWTKVVGARSGSGALTLTFTGTSCPAAGTDTAYVFRIYETVTPTTYELAISNGTGTCTRGGSGTIVATGPTGTYTNATAASASSGWQEAVFSVADGLPVHLRAAVGGYYVYSDILTEDRYLTAECDGPGAILVPMQNNVSVLNAASPGGIRVSHCAFNNVYSKSGTKAIYTYNSDGNSFGTLVYDNNISGFSTCVHLSTVYGLTGFAYNRLVDCTSTALLLENPETGDAGIGLIGPGNVFSDSVTANYGIDWRGPGNLKIKHNSFNGYVEQIHLEPRMGVVNVSGTSVTWVSGNRFRSTMAGGGFVAGSTVAATVASYNSSTSLTLATSQPTCTGCSYYVNNTGQLQIEGNTLDSWTWTTSNIHASGGIPFYNFQFQNNFTSNPNPTTYAAAVIIDGAGWYFGSVKGNNFQTSYTASTKAVDVTSGSYIDINDNQIVNHLTGVNIGSGVTEVSTDGNKCANTNTTNCVLSAASATLREITPVTYTQLSALTAANSSTLYCSNCKRTSNSSATCTSSGSGARATRINGAWKCDDGTMQNAFLQSGNSFGATAELGTNDAYGITFRVNGTGVWSLPTTGHWYAATNNTYDIGAGLSANSPRSVYAATSMVTPKIGRDTTAGLTLFTDSADRWNVTSTGMFRPAATDTYDIGDLTTPLRVRGVYPKIVDTALSGGTGDYIQTRKIQLFDNTGSSTGASYWDMNVVMSGVGAGQNSYFYLRDNGGNTVWRADKIASGAAISRTTIYTDLLPDSTANTRKLGYTTQRWDEINGASLDLSGAANITGNLSAAVINATGSPAYRVSGTTVINASRAATFTDLTINTSSAPAVGDVWTATSTGGAGSWQTPTAGTAPFIDSTAIIKGSADATKLLKIEVDGFTTATTRTLTPQNNSYTIAGIDIAQTFTQTQTFNGTVAMVLNGTITGDLLFSSSNTYIVGNSTNYLNAVHANNVVAYASFLPASGVSTVDIGSATRRIRKTYTGDLDITGTVTPPSGTAFTGTKTVRASGGASDCTLTFSAGIMTGGTC